MFDICSLKPNTFYTGSSRDGSDIHEVEGMYVSSCGNFWSSDPFTKQEERWLRKDAHKKRMRNLMNSQFKQQGNENRD